MNHAPDSITAENGGSFDPQQAARGGVAGP